MTRPQTLVPARLEAPMEALLVELGAPGEFPAEVLADAERAAGEPDLPDTDWTEIPFVTIDPPGSMDLDQAVHLERRGAGFRVRYAIADLPAFVRPGSPVDQEARRRGQTLYAPHRRVPLHPPVLSEAVASLLPGEVRPAYVWVIDLDADAEPVAVDVRRAMVRSRERFSFETVQGQHDHSATPEPFALLPDVGRALIAQEQSRGGAALETPDQEVEEVEGAYVLRYRPRSEVEDWNAQLSLLTGMAAADLMLAGETGILRTMPAPDERAAARFRRQAKALGAPWVAEQALGDYLRSLDASDARQLAVLHESAALFRGAGYTPFDGAVPEHVVQSAVAAEYAHVTAPLRRLVDRFGLVICEAMCRDTDVPDWVHQALPGLPELMAAPDRLARALERATLDLVEAAVLESRVGQEFDAVVVDLPEQRRGGNETNGGTRAQGTVQLQDPAVLAPCDGDLRLGTEVRVRLVTADVSSRTVRFTVVG